MPLEADDPSRHALVEVRLEEASPVVRCVRLGAQACQFQPVAFLACSEERFRPRSQELRTRTSSSEGAICEAA